MTKIRKCKLCGEVITHQNRLISTCKACTYKKGYKIKQVGKKKAQRLKNGGSEKKLFMDIAVKRAIDGICKCNQCGKSIRMIDLNHWNFSHIIPKSKGEEYRLDEDNIEILCVGCHFKEHNGQTLKTEFNN